jgi:hypothetical protein
MLSFVVRLEFGTWFTLGIDVKRHAIGIFNRKATVTR